MIKNKKIPMITSVLVLGAMIIRIGTSISVPFLSVFLYFQLKVDFYFTGIIIGLYYLFFAFGGFFGGIIAQRFGTSKTLLISLFVYSIIYILFGLSYELFILKINLIPIFLILNASAGFCRTCIEATSSSILSITLNENMKAKIYGRRYVFGNIGSAVGPFLGTISGIAGHAKGFYATGILCLVYFILTLICVITEKTNVEGNIKQINCKEAYSILKKDSVLFYYLLAGIFSYLVFVQQEFLLGQLISNKFGNTTLYAKLLTINALIIIVLQTPLTVRLLRNHHPLSLMQCGAILIGIGFMIISYANNNYILYIIGEVIITLGEILLFSIGNILIDKIAPENLSNIYFGVMSIQYIGKAVGPVIGGIMLNYCSNEIALLIFSLLSVTTFFIYRKSYMNTKNLLSPQATLT